MGKSARGLDHPQRLEVCSEESEAGTVIDHSVYRTPTDLREGAVQNSLAGEVMMKSRVEAVPLPLERKA